MKQYTWLILTLCLLLAACQTGNEVAEVTATATNTRVVQPTKTRPVQTIVVVTPPIAPSATATETPTATATPLPSATPLPTDTPTATATPLPVPVTSVHLETVVSGFTQPLYLTHAGDDRLFVVEQPGAIYIVQDGQRLPTPFLNLRDRVNNFALEQGLLGLAFHPNYADNGYFYVNYTNYAGNTVVARYQVSPDNPNVADRASEVILFTVAQPFENHNGGHLVFGPDGYLYVGLGDGGAANDPYLNGQNRGTLLGTLLRLDVDGGEPYAIPPDNPFVADDTMRNEIWAYGLRNPWRFSFDRITDDLFIADVGQNIYEEVNFTPAGSPGGLNYGWNLMEGFHCFADPGCDPADPGLVLPVAEYDHTNGCSVTGGYVYRGQDYPGLYGNYFFADYCVGSIWSLVPNGDGTWTTTMVLERPNIQIASFGEDINGELYVLSYTQGQILRLTP